MNAEKHTQNEMTTNKAAELAGVTTATIRNWISDFGIGIKKGGRWIVFKNKLEKILSGEIHYDNQGRPKES